MFERERGQQLYQLSMTHMMQQQQQLQPMMMTMPAGARADWTDRDVNTLALTETRDALTMHAALFTSRRVDLAAGAANTRAYCTRPF